MSLSPELIGITSLCITNVISPIISWFAAKKKYGAEVDNKVIENMQASLEFYKRLSDDNKERLDMVLGENVQLRATNERFEREIADLRKQLATLSMLVASYGLVEKSGLPLYGNEENNSKTEDPS